MLQDIFLAYSLLSPRMRARWAVVVPLSLAGAIAEAVSALAVFGLLRILTNPDDTARIPVAAEVYRRLPNHEPRTVILTFTMLVILLYVVRNVVLVVNSYVRERVVLGSILEISQRMLHTYLDAPYRLLLGRNSAELISRVQRATEAVTAQLLSASSHILTEALIVMGLVGLLVLAAPLVTLVAVVVTLLLMLVPSLLTRGIYRRLGTAEVALDREVLQDLQQSLGAVKEVKLGGHAPFFLQQFTHRRARLARVQRWKNTLQDGLRLSVETVFVVALLFVILLMVWSGRTGSHVLSLLGLYAYAGFRLVPSANRLNLYAGSIRNGRSFLRSLTDDLDQMAAMRARDVEPAGPDLHLRHAIAFERVSFRYEDDRPDVLAEVTLSIARGESLGIIGPTGSGKSTLIDLLLGLLEPSRGRVLVDGRDIRTNLRSWQRRIGYVPQAFYLLDDTLERNVAFGEPSDRVDASRLARAISLAQLDDVVAALPGGAQTRLGERGAALSGGQRQRVAIARALYHDPEVLVFDEATAALDPQTERELTDAIAALQGVRTVVVVAHRLGTVRRCDRLVMLREGRIAATGSYDELLATDARFRAMARASA